RGRPEPAWPILSEEQLAAASTVTVWPSAMVTLSDAVGTAPPGHGAPGIVELQLPLPALTIEPVALVAWLPASGSLTAPSVTARTIQESVVDGVRPVRSSDV